MGKLQSKIPELAAALGWSEREFVGRCFAAGLSLDTGQKLWAGDVNVNAQTLAIVAKVLGITDIGELINIGEDGSH